MLKKVVTYTDFNGDERSETLYFNLTEVEVARLEVRYPGGLEKHINNLNAQERPDEVLDLFETVLKMAYGTKSDDGRHFHKSEEETKKFGDSAAYTKIFVELLTDDAKAADFFNAMVFVVAPAASEDK